MSKYTLEWVGQAGYVLRINDTVVAVDPYCSEVPCMRGAIRLYPPVIPENGLEADYVFASHEHKDHLDIETLRSHIKAKTLVATEASIKIAIEEEKLPMEAIRIVHGQTIDFGDFKVRAMFADHHRADAVGYLFEVDGIKLYISGDTLYNVEGLQEVVDAAPDIMCVCINGKLGNMNFFEAERFVQSAKPKLAIPMHYDTVMHNTENPDLFVGDLLEAGIYSRVLERGREYIVKELLEEAENNV